MTGHPDDSQHSTLYVKRRKHHAVQRKYFVILAPFGRAGFDQLGRRNKRNQHRFISREYFSIYTLIHSNRSRRQFFAEDFDRLRIGIVYSSQLQKFAVWQIQEDAGSITDQAGA